MRTTSFSRSQSDPHYGMAFATAAVLAFLVLVLPCRGQGTLTIHFEGPAYSGGPSPQPPGTFTTISSYSESGVTFWNPYGLENLTLMGSGASGMPDNGSAYLVTAGGAKLGVGLASGAYFNLTSFEAAEIPGPGGTTLQLVGYHVMGARVTNYFTMDGINDGTGPLQDFQTFFPDSQFQNVYRVDVLSGSWALDNLVISGVPEPSACGLLSVGASIAVFVRRGSKSRRK